MTKTFLDEEDYIAVKPWGHDLPTGEHWSSKEGKLVPNDPPRGFTHSGCYYDTTLDAFYIGHLGFCGCGKPRDEQRFMLKVLSAIAKRSYENRHMTGVNDVELWTKNSDEISDLFSNNGTFEHHYLQWLDSLHLLEHGSTVYGSWLNDLGFSVLKMLIAELPNENESEG